MNQEPFIIPILVNKEYFARTMPDTSYLSYSLINSRFTQKHNLERIQIEPRSIIGYNSLGDRIVNEVAIIEVDINRYKE